MPGALDDERAELLDLADEAIGSRGVRCHTFPWLLRGDEPWPVDAWWPDLGLVVQVVLGDADEADAHRLGHVLTGYDVTLVLLRRRQADAYPEGVRAFVLGTLGSEEARGWSAWGQAGWTAYLPAGGEESWEDEDWEIGEPFEEGEEEELPPADAANPRERLETLGWRGRAIGLTVLGALALGRRALGAGRLGPERLRDEQLEVLLVLAVIDEDQRAGDGQETAQLAQVLDRSRPEVEEALAGLADGGLVVRGTHSLEDHEAWLLTRGGLDAVLFWLARVRPLVGDWPPDVNGADAGPGPLP
jgi:hypothetical protein